MANDFQVNVNVHQNDDGTQVVTINLPASCPATGGGTTPPPAVINPPPAPLSVLALSQTTPSLLVNVTWPAVSQATLYEVQRQNVTDAPGVWIATTFSGINNAFVDGTVVDTKDYIYRVRAGNLDINGLVQYSAYTQSNTVTAHAATPLPPPPVVIDSDTPRNLTSIATAVNAFDLDFDGVAGATSYKVYRDMVHVATLTAPTTHLAITAAAIGLDGVQLWWPGQRYRVSSLKGSPPVESRLSAAVHTLGNNPGWDPGATPATPSAPETFPQWQGGAINLPRNLVRWKAPGTTSAAIHALWNVYRDGVLIAENLFVMYYIDDNVTAGVTYQYKVTRAYWRIGVGSIAESAQSAGTNCVTRSAAPATGGTVTGITAVINDGSAIIKFNSFGGALDYRAYPTGTQDYKYRGDHSINEIEVNGISRTVPTTIIVEALNMLGPFEHDEIPKADPMKMHVNGQGDPSNVPVVLASGSISIQAVRRVWSGQTPIFLDCFDTRPTFTVVNGVESEIYNAQGATFAPNNSGNPWLQKLQGTNWIIRQYIADAPNTKTFFGHEHLMDALFDGGGQHNHDPSPPHNNNATWLMEAVQVASIPISPQVLHITMEVDAHFNSRRWCGVLITPENDPIVRPAIQKLVGNEAPSWSGDALAWEIEADVHKLFLFDGTGNGTASMYSQLNFGFVANQNGPGAPARFGRADRSFYNATYHSSLGRALNGPANFLDRRSRFDMLLSTTWVRIYEEGIFMHEISLTVPLSWNRAKVSFSHHVYHTANDIDEIVQRDQDERNWVNMRSFDEVRHWDNLGFRILASAPANTVDIRTI